MVTVIVSHDLGGHAKSATGVALWCSANISQGKGPAPVFSYADAGWPQAKAGHRNALIKYVVPTFIARLGPVRSTPAVMKSKGALASYLALR